MSQTISGALAENWAEPSRAEPSRAEEILLRRQLPRYEDYARRTGRLVPHLW